MSLLQFLGGLIVYGGAMAGSCAAFTFAGGAQTTREFSRVDVRRLTFETIDNSFVPNYYRAAKERAQ